MNTLFTVDAGGSPFWGWLAGGLGAAALALAGCTAVLPPGGLGDTAASRAPAPAAGQPAAPSANGSTLLARLGGREALQQVANRLLDRTSTDPRTRRSFDGVKLSTLKGNVGAYLCRVADGDCLYEGQNMQKSHGDLDLKPSEFDVMVGMLREELDAAGVPADAKNELLRRLAPSKRDIVHNGGVPRPAAPASAVALGAQP